MLLKRGAERKATLLKQKVCNDRREKYISRALEGQPSPGCLEMFRESPVELNNYGNAGLEREKEEVEQNKN